MRNAPPISTLIADILNAVRRLRAMVLCDFVWVAYSGGWPLVRLPIRYKENTDWSLAEMLQGASIDRPHLRRWSRRNNDAEVVGRIEQSRSRCDFLCNWAQG